MAFSTYFGNAIINHMLRNQAFSPPSAIYVSLHNGDPGLAGGNEIAGASRQAVTLGAASNKATSNTGVLNFSDMPVAYILGAGIWDASTNGNFIIGGPLAGGSFTASGSTDTFTAAGHGLVDGAVVAFCPAPGLTLPTGITAWTPYFVINADTDTFQVSLAEGGAAVNLTTDGGGRYIKVKRTNAGDTLQIPIGDLDLSID
jgi:hypothetical protein